MAGLRLITGGAKDVAATARKKKREQIGKTLSSLLLPVVPEIGVQHSSLLLLCSLLLLRTPQIDTLIAKRPRRETQDNGRSVKKKKKQKAAGKIGEVGSFCSSQCDADFLHPTDHTAVEINEHTATNSSP